jgi:K+ transporter
MPRVNLLLALGVMLLVVGFKESSSLASAYGISVTGEMLMTTILLFIVMRHLWKWQLGAALALAVLFGVIDIGFFSANAVKVLDGGWVSIGVYRFAQPGDVDRALDSPETERVMADVKNFTDTTVVLRSVFDAR